MCCRILVKNLKDFKKSDLNENLIKEATYVKGKMNNIFRLSGKQFIDVLVGNVIDLLENLVEFCDVQLLLCGQLRSPRRFAAGDDGFVFTLQVHEIAADRVDCVGDLTE